MLIESYSFTGLEKGPHLLVMGAVHGDEPCGPLAIGKVVEALHNGKMVLQRGKVTFVPVANPHAYAVNQRFVDKNLNRIFARHEVLTCQEERIVNQLCDVVDECDVLLDIHSFHTPGVPFVFRDYDDPATVTFAESLGFPYIMSGWPEVYGSTEADGLNMGDTVQYAHLQGKTAVLVECGQHTDPETIGLAEASIWNALTHLELVAGDIPVAPCVEVRMKRIWAMPEQGGKLVRDWQNLDPVRAGEVLAVLTDGNEIVAPADGFVILPKVQVQIGQEWFYFGEAVAAEVRAAA